MSECQTVWCVKYRHSHKCTISTRSGLEVYLFKYVIVNCRTVAKITQSKYGV